MFSTRPRLRRKRGLRPRGGGEETAALKDKSKVDSMPVMHAHVVRPQKLIDIVIHGDKRIFPFSSVCSRRHTCLHTHTRTNIADHTMAMLFRATTELMMDGRQKMSEEKSSVNMIYIRLLRWKYQHNSGPPNRQPNGSQKYISYALEQEKREKSRRLDNRLYEHRLSR